MLARLTYSQRASSRGLPRKSVERRVVSIVYSQMTFEPKHPVDREAMTLPHRQPPAFLPDATPYVGEASYFRTGP